MHDCDNRPWFKKLKEVFPITHIPAEYYMEELKKLVLIMSAITSKGPMWL